MAIIWLTLLVVALGVAAAPGENAEPDLYRSAIVNTPRADPIDYRLPTNIRPTKYRIGLKPYITDLSFTFDGHVHIQFDVSTTTDKIVLHTNKLVVNEGSISVRAFPTPSVPGFVVFNTTWDSVRHFYTIQLNRDMIPGTYIVEMDYTGVLDSDMKGFYRSSYVESGLRKWLATTQLQATEARRAFPCFDEPAMKATFEISISREPKFHAISNMPLLDSVAEGGRIWDQFHETPIMSTYLIAFIVSEFEFLEDVPAQLRIYAQPLMVHQAKYGLEVSVPILNWMADYVAINYTLPKMDEAAIPDFDAGAMENWGLVTYRERLILFEEGVSTSETKQRIATVISHEYAHQWFGDLVSPQWWSYAWLNEGFATYFEFFATANVETTWRLEEQFVPRELQSAMAADSLDSSHPMTYEVGSPESISAIFDAINYNKAGTVLRMMKHIVSPNTFRTALNKYLNARSFNVATPTDLFNAMDDQYIADSTNPGVLPYIPKVMRTWTEQMGYPVLTVTRNYITFTASLTQERFLLKPAPGNTHNYKWHIPLTYTQQTAPDFMSTAPTDWLNPEDENKLLQRMPGADQWVIFNIQETGYYRVNYDPTNWRLLSAYLDSSNYNRIHLLNRGQLIDDSFNLARAGIIDYSIALDLSRYLVREIDYVPWYSAFNALTFINNKLQHAADYHHLRNYISKLIALLYDTVGFDEGASDGHVLKLNRAAAVRWSCLLGEEHCTLNARNKLQTWMMSGLNKIAPDLRSAVYCTALRHGDVAEWNFMWQQYKTSTVSSESELIITSLGCTTNETILNRYLSMTLEDGSEIRRQDGRAVFTSVYNNPVGVNIALDFFINNWADASQMYGGLNAIGSLLIGIANRLNTEEQATKLGDFLRMNHADLVSAGAEVSMQNAINIVDETLAWQTKHGKSIIDWVRNELTSTTQAPTTTPTASTGSTTISTGSTTVSTGSTTVSTGSTTVSTGSTTASTGSTTASTGSTTVSTGSTTVPTGSTTASTGSTTASTGSTTDPSDGGAAGLASLSAAVLLGLAFIICTIF